jgi:tetratricopeptide (TPR) repeat protein
MRSIGSNKKKAINLKLNGVVRLHMPVRKNLAWVCLFLFGVPRNPLAISLVFCCVLWVAPGLADEAAEASKTDSLSRQVVELCQAGKYQEAISIARQLLEISEKINGPEHPNTAVFLHSLALLHTRMRDYAKAEPLYQRALAIGERALGPEHPLNAATLHSLAELYYSMRDYAKAEPLYQHALAIREKALGPEHPDTAGGLNDLAALYLAMGDYARAEPPYKRALAICEKAHGPEHPDTVKSLYNLATLYYSMGDYARAEPPYKRALAIREKALGPEHPDTATSLNNLAVLYCSMGDYARAEPFYKRAVTICEKALGPEHRDTAKSLNNLATLYYSMGDYATAEPPFKRAVAICEKAHGPEHPDTAKSLNNLALLYRTMGDYARAEPSFKRAVTICEKALGPEHPDTAKSLNNLALLYWTMGDYTRAEPSFKRAMAICEKALGLEHPDTAMSFENLALLSIDLGKARRALEFALQAEKARETHLGNILSFTSEQQRLAFQETTNPFALCATLGSAPDIAQAILHRKGVVLESLLEDRLVAEASKDPKQRQVIDELRAAKQRYTQLLMEVPKDFAAEARQRREAELEKRAGQVEQLESILARQVSGLGRARRALSVTLAEVQGSLATDQVLVELLRYRHYMGKNKFEDHYGALVMASKNELKWIPLGAAAEIEKNVELYRKSVRAELTHYMLPRNVEAYHESERANTDESTLHVVLRSLHDQLWVPIEKALPAEAKTIILSPDGALNFISFATLLNAKGKFLIEEYSIRYVASGRDLLREREASATELMAVFGNPDFGNQLELIAQQTETSSALAMRASEMRDFGNMYLGALPGTDQECAGLKAQAWASGKPIQVFLGVDATEAQLREVNSPRILHLATHGFFLPESKDERRGNEQELGTGGINLIGDAQRDRRTPVILKNPMHRSGLALAGAQRTLDAWTKGEAPPSDNDGIVTAEEVGGLKLKGTWLVVLSACDTGAGEAKAGEGVLGLRRGFIQAGAQNLLMTLWPISDMTTVQIMRDFYDRALASGNAPQSLLEVQREWLVRLRKEAGLLYAVNRAGAFIMSSKGNAELSATSTKSERKEVPFSFRKLPEPGSLPYTNWRKPCVDRPIPPDSPPARRWSNVRLSILSKG